MTVPEGFERCEPRDIDVDGGASGRIRLHAQVGRDARQPPLLMLHGFPQTHAIWHRVAARLSERYRLVCPDLRGYGDSEKPAGLPDHANYAKRTMAADVAALMRSLGHERFAVVGHDRGARVAHRLALDRPEAVERLCVLDIAPTLTMYDATNFAFAQAYWHWFFLTQPAPLPETMLGADPVALLRSFLGGWGGRGLSVYSAAALAEYERCWADPAMRHAACEDYRASAGIDLVHDRASDAAGERVRCPLLVLWGANGVVGRQFDPLAAWRAKCDGPVSGSALATGHFIPEEAPDALVAALLDFIATDG